MAQKPKGIRNRNPGNIDDVGIPWQGLIPKGDPRHNGEERFCVFVDAQHGIRALAKNLTAYYQKHGLHTVRGMIDRWAPSRENNTKAYVNVVARAVGVPPDQRIDLDFPTVRKMTLAIIKHENGMQPYTDEVIDAGLSMAGFHPGRRDSFTKSRTVKATSAGAAATAAGTAIGAVEDVQAVVEKVKPLADAIGLGGVDPKWIVAGLSVVAVIAFGIVAYARWDDWQRGRR